MRLIDYLLLATVWLRADDLAALIREHGNPVHIAEL